MTVQERETVRAFIETMIGKPKDWAPDTMSLVERMRRREAYDRLNRQLMSIAEKSGPAALNTTIINEGYRVRGVTASGRPWTLEYNNGWTIRSQTCGTLYIDGKFVFSSGRLSRALEYILKS